MKITKKQIKGLKTTKKGTLKNYVINSILRQDEPKQYMEDVLYSGCQSGIVTELIYYVDTEKFFNKFSTEILEIMQEFKESVGELNINYDTNTLSWFAYEEVLRNIAYSLDMEV